MSEQAELPTQTEATVAPVLSLATAVNLTPNNPFDHVLIVHGTPFLLNKDCLISNKPWMAFLLEKSDQIYDGSSTVSLIQTLLSMIQTLPMGTDHLSSPINKKIVDDLVLLKLKESFGSLSVQVCSDPDITDNFIELFCTKDDNFLRGFVQGFLAESSNELVLFRFLKRVGLLNTQHASYFEGTIPETRDPHGLYDFKICRSLISRTVKLDILRGLDLDVLTSIFKSDWWTASEYALMNFIIDLVKDDPKFRSLFSTLRLPLLREDGLLLLSDWIDISKDIVEMMKAKTISQTSQSRSNGPFNLYSRNMVYIGDKSKTFRALRAADSTKDFELISKSFANGNITYFHVPGISVSPLSNHGNPWCICCEGNKEVNRSFTLTPNGPVITDTTEVLSISATDTTSVNIQHRLYVKA